MKKSKELLDLPIISISNGKQIGKVNGLIINPDKFSVDFLTVEQEEWQVSVKVVPYKKVVAIGEFAVMVEQENSVFNLNEIPFLNKLLNKKIHLIGSQVLTKKGKLSGEIFDYFVNEENGQLESLLIYSGNKELFFPIGNVISLGKECVIINDSLLEINDQIQQMEQGEQRVNPKIQSPNAELKAMLDELLKGNSINKEIFGKAGEMLFKKGTLLTEENTKGLQAKIQSPKNAELKAILDELLKGNSINKEIFGKVGEMLKPN